MNHVAATNEARRELPPEAWNQTTRSYPLDVPLASFIEAQVERAKDRIAVSFRSATLTYDQLNRQANQLAHHLIGLGVGPDVMVGICVERSLDMVVGLLAILKAGGAYVPLDPEYPEDRLAFMTSDAAVPVLLTTRALGDRVRAPGARRIDLDADRSLIAEYRDDDPPRSLTPKNLAYTIYTSGSTGKPKGAMNTQEGIVNRLLWMQEAYGLTPEDRVLQKTPFSFDVSVWELFWPLMVGARLVMAEPGGHKDPAYLVRTIRREGISILHFVPSMLSLFNRADGLEEITSLRHVFCSGEALPHEQVQRFFKRVSARLHNLYGPTEAAVDVTSWECVRGAPGSVVPIGRPIANTYIRILTPEGERAAVGEAGELHIGGVGLARGYWNRPELTAEKFVVDPFGGREDRLYKTGDLARYLPDGNIEYLGRIDFQVKIRGLRIELGEIEARLLTHPAIKEAVIVASDDDLGEKRLLAYLVAEGEGRPTTEELRVHLLRELPDYMVPAAFVFLPKMPLSPNGKVDRGGFAKGPLPRPALAQTYIAPRGSLEKAIAAIWCELLNLTEVGVHDNFYDLGGNSLLALETVEALARRHSVSLPLVKLFQYPSVRAIAEFLLKATPEDAELDVVVQRAARQRADTARGAAEEGIAIIGMSGRFPGAYDVDELWANLVAGRETVTFFTKEQLGPGLDPEITDDPRYVRARGIIPDGDKFDAEFFGINPAEASVIDPQQRVFLELAWAALESAGYAPASFDGLIGVYAGMGNNYYLPLNVATRPDRLKMVGPFPVMVGNEKDHIATRVAHKLNLTGPAVSVHTACSTSLTAIDQAFFSLVTRQCDIALAGGISLQTPQYSGQLAEEGGVFARDGHCRPFDAAADGTMFSDSAGIVVMKRLSEAVRDRDTIYAVIKSTALNNDGANKVSYLAPSVQGQKRVVAAALARAGVSADTIGYVEAHGTATPIGDPIEVEALTQVFRRDTSRTQFCGIGSIKSNLGHPTIAAGVASVIKVALALKHEQIPATLHYDKPNPKIDFESSPFYVVSALTPWRRGASVRRAGVSSFGFGGTNAHAVLEEAPPDREPAAGAARQLVLLSAKSKDALQRMSAALADHLDAHPDVSLADVAFTLTVGRTHLSHRRYVVGATPREAAALLRSPERETCGERLLDRASPEVVFLFPGQGSQYLNMGLTLYRAYPVFREVVDTCAEILRPSLGCDLRAILYPATADAAAAARLRDTRFQQPAVFTIEYALARLWASWGVVPDALVGHSIGELAAATIASVFTLEDALDVIATRGRMMSELPGGAMLSVRASADELAERLPPRVSLAASNADAACVVAGPHEAIAALALDLERDGLPCKVLETSHAFHSAMMDPIVEPFTRFVGTKALGEARVPIMSTLTGRWVTPGEMSDPRYWGRHLREPVRFAEAIKRVCEDPDRVLVEVGPGAQASSLARQQAALARTTAPIASLATKGDHEAEQSSLLRAVGELWAAGRAVPWTRFWGDEERRRIPLPTYRFARTRHWIDPAGPPERPAARAEPPERPAAPVAVVRAPPVARTPREALVHELVRIVEAISGTELGPGVDESRTFAQMGMDSLFLNQISYVVKKELGVAVSFRQLTDEASTISKLADLVARARDAGAAAAGPTVAPAPVPTPPPVAFADDAVPTTDLQRESFDVARASGADASCAFHESATITLAGASFDRAAMDRALSLLVARHEALRCVFDEDGRTLRVRAAVSLAPSFVDLASSGRPEDVRDRLRREILADATTAFDLHAGPLVRARIFALGSEEHVVVLSAHLAVCDMWSLDVLIRELGAFYTAEVTGVPASLPPADSYRDYALGEEAFARTDAHGAMTAYWRERLREPVRDGLRGSGRAGARGFRAGRVDLALEPEVVRSLVKLGADSGCSLYTVLLAGLALERARHVEEPRLILGMPVAGQALSQRTSLVGHALRCLPLVVSVDPAQPLERFLTGLRADVASALENARGADLGVKSASETPAEPRRSPLITTCLSMSPKMDERDLAFGGLKARYEANPRAFESFELFVNAVSGKGDELVLETQYRADLFDEADIRRLHDDLAATYASMGSDARSALGSYAPPRVEPPARPAVSTLLPPGDHAAFFGDGGSLYGICHIPKRPRGDVGILLCCPIAREYMRAFWACRQLANQLMAQGFPVLRFDYLGTGDSRGDTGDWDLDAWTDDVVTAGEELRRRSGVREISVVSVRLGAAVAARALERGLAVRDVVLWDPVVSGAEYLKGLAKSHAELLAREGEAFPYPTPEALDVDPDELGGFRFEPSLRDAIGRVVVTGGAFARCRRLALCVSEDRAEYRRLAASLQRARVSTDYRVVRDGVGDWDDVRFWETALLPSLLLESIVSFFGEGER